MTSREELERRLGEEVNALLGASRALTERTAAVFHPALRPAAFHLARWLYAFGPVNPSVLAREVAMDRSSTSSLVGQLKKHGLAASTPDPADSRGVIVELTAMGRQRVATALDLRGSEFADRLSTFSDVELEALTALLERFVRPGHAD